MEPKLPSPDRGPELRSADSVSNGEVVLQPSRYETGSGRTPEHQEQHGEATPSAGPTDDSVIVLPVPAAPAPTDDTIVTLPQVQGDTPATANDNELIEKEWVDKAKKVIAETKDDPYRREREVSKLQADYLFKRYGRKLGSPQ
jgi:hypothetical protein